MCDNNETLQPDSNCGENVCNSPSQNASIISNNKCCPCQDGLIRHKGNCIPDSLCPTCDANPQSQPTGSCDDKACNGSSVAGPDLSASICCKCDSGFIRHEGNCIPNDQCPISPCGSNEIHDNCVQSLECQKNCETLNNPKKCKQKCEPGCKCKKGFVRDKNQKCIKVSSCKNCPKNQAFRWDCREKTCKKFSSIREKKKCEFKCYCKDGFFKNRNGNCVRSNRCTGNPNQSH